MENYQKAIILTCLTVVAFALRWYLMPSHLFFGPEQGRDFLVIRDVVVNHKWTLIGSKTDIAGIFHGPIFYYVSAIPFAISRGNPLAVSAFFIFVQSISVYLIYLFAYELTQSRRVGYIASALFTVSFLCIVYARWLSNPPLSIPLSLLLMLCILRLVRGKKVYSLYTAVTFGLLGQAEFINFILFAGILTSICILYRKQIAALKAPTKILSVIILILSSVGSYIIFDTRHEFLVSKSVMKLLTGDNGSPITLGMSAIGTLQSLFVQAASFVGSWQWQVGSVVFLLIMASIWKRVRQRHDMAILLLWIVIPPIIFTLLRHGTLDHLYVGVAASFIIGIASVIDQLFAINRWVGSAILTAIIILNLYTWKQNLPMNNHVFFQSSQSAVRYSDQLAVLDWIYAHAQKTPFSFQAFTIPFFLQDAWTYLLQYYAQPKYGYLPDNQGRKRIYLVIQQDPNDAYNALFRKNWHTSITREWKTLNNYEKIGDYVVEEWIL